MAAQLTRAELEKLSPAARRQIEAELGDDKDPPASGRAAERTTRPRRRPRRGRVRSTARTVTREGVRPVTSSTRAGAVSTVRLVTYALLLIAAYNVLRFAERDPSRFEQLAGTPGRAVAWLLDPNASIPVPT